MPGDRRVSGADQRRCSGTIKRSVYSSCPPEYIRSDNELEVTTHRVPDWLENVGVKTLFIEPGSPWENGFIESFNGKLRDELLNMERFDTLLEARVLIESWRVHHNSVRLHSAGL